MRVLLVDDDALVIRLMKSALGDRYEVLTARSVEEALKVMRELPDIAIIDLDLEKRLQGLTLISPLKKAGIKTVVVSSHDEEEIIEKCYKEGCDLYYSKGVVLESIHQIINDILIKDKADLREEIFTEKFITTSDRLKTDIKRAFKAMLQSSNILITGETGTGKSELSKLFHQESKVTGEFVAINCAGIPRELLESELFGHTKGAFTGADKAKTGKLKLADNGVLFLDEINSMSLEMQAKLLKAVEEKRFYPVGSERMIESQFKLIAASNENLFQMVSEGRFRLDLLQRLCGTMIELPPLRERHEDIFAMIKFFNVSQRKIFLLPEVKEMIAGHNWSGNSREVKRFVEFCLALPGGKVSGLDFGEFKKSTSVENMKPNQDLSYWVTESLNKGLDQVTDDFRKLVIEEVMKTRSRNVTMVMKELKISTRQFYKHVGVKKNKMLVVIPEGQVHETELH